MHGDELERFERMKIIEPQTGATACVGILAGGIGMAALLVLAWWWM